MVVFFMRTPTCISRLNFSSERRSNWRWLETLLPTPTHKFGDPVLRSIIPKPSGAPSPTLVFDFLDPSALRISSLVQVCSGYLGEPPIIAVLNSLDQRQRVLLF